MTERDIRLWARQHFPASLSKLQRMQAVSWWICRSGRRGRLHMNVKPHSWVTSTVSRIISQICPKLLSSVQPDIFPTTDERPLCQLRSMTSLKPLSKTDVICWLKLGIINGRLRREMCKTWGCYFILNGKQMRSQWPCAVLCTVIFLSLLSDCWYTVHHFLGLLDKTKGVRFL